MIPDQPPSTDPGFNVAGGDPNALSAAAAIHSDAADMLAMHAAVVSGAASSLDSSWQGQAAGSYQQLSQIVHSRFNLAADGARTAAAGLRQWSEELDRCQRAGKAAMQECEHWLKQQQHWFFQLQDAQRALTTAQAQLSAVSAPNPLTGAAPAAPAPGSNPMANPFSPISAVAIASARNAVTSAEHDVIVAKGKLKEATEQVLIWQRKGHQAWDDATTAAEQATGLLDGIRVTPPPLAGFSRTEPTVSRPLPWYDEALNIAGDVVGGVAAVAGVATALTFWIPGVGEVSAATAGAAGATEAGIDWAKVAVDDPGASVSGAVVDTVLAAPGLSDVRDVGDAPSGLASLGSKGLGGSLADNPVAVSRAVSGTVSGAAGAYGAGATIKGAQDAAGAGSVDVHGDPAKAGAVLAGTGEGR